MKVVRLKTPTFLEILFGLFRPWDSRAQFDVIEDYPEIEATLRAPIVIRDMQGAFNAAAVATSAAVRTQVDAAKKKKIGHGRPTLAEAH